VPLPSTTKLHRVRRVYVSSIWVGRIGRLPSVSIVQVAAHFGTHRKTKVAQKRNDPRLGFWIWRCWRKQSDRRTLSGTSVCIVIKRGTRHDGYRQGKLFVALLGQRGKAGQGCELRSDKGAHVKPRTTRQG
jgi:hypothetical protein